MSVLPEFVGFPKIARLSRLCIITEKIDGTNAQILITEDGNLFAGSRTRWLTLSADNHGFCAWTTENRDELMELGPGRHFGEWWGKGIQRGYGVPDKRLSLFNVSRWVLADRLPVEGQKVLPACVGLVPVLATLSELNDAGVYGCMEELARTGSRAAPGFMDPEGLVAFHTAANICFKKTLKGDEAKGAKE
jgi:hypothetical protein